MSKNTNTDPNPNPNPNPEPKPPANDDGVLDKFTEIKERYEKELETKDKKIQELEEQLKKKDKQVDATINDLNEEVNQKLEQAEKMKELQASVNELLNDKANALVDKYINEGKLVPAQREKALSLCLADQDMFIELYENAPSIVDTNPKPKSHRITNADKMVDYFKN